MSYSITGGNVGNAFEVVPDLGQIKIRGKLDYEKGPRVSAMLSRRVMWVGYCFIFESVWPKDCRTFRDNSGISPPQ